MILDRLTQAREASPDDEVRTVADDHMQSPILRAEQELLRLQGSVGPGTREFAPKLQRKFYGTEVPSHTGGQLDVLSQSVSILGSFLYLIALGVLCFC